MSDVVKLYYFDARGRAEAIRLTFEASEVTYEDHRMTKEQWGQRKKEAPYGLMPFIEYKGVKYGESKAIAAFVAKLCGMAGSTPEDALRVDEVFCLATNLLEEMGKTYFEPDQARKGELQKKLAGETIPKYLSFFEKLLEHPSRYFVVQKLTQADLAVYEITNMLLKHHPTALDGYSHVQEMRANVEKHPKVKPYLDTRPPTDH